MPSKSSTFTSKDGKHTIQTSNARERVRLLSQGYREDRPVAEPDAGQPEQGQPDEGQPDAGKPDEGKPDEAAADAPKESKGRAAAAVPKAPAGKSSK